MTNRATGFHFDEDTGILYFGNVAVATSADPLPVLTASKAVASAADGTITTSATTATELGYLSGVTSAVQTQINTKAPSASPTFTGTVVLPTATSIGVVLGTEIAFLSGVTSGIQTQLNALAPINSPTFTGTVTIPTGGQITSPTFTGVPLLPSYLKGSLPAVGTAGGAIYVSDAARSPSGTGSVCFSDGSNWIDVTTGAAVV